VGYTRPPKDADTDRLQKFFSGKIGKQHFLIPRPPEQGNGGATMNDRTID